MFTIDPKIKKICSTIVLVGTAVGSFIGVFAEDKRNKEFEEMKKAIEELRKK